MKEEKKSYSESKMYMRITEWKQSVKIREQKARKSMWNGGKERMNPHEKALKSKHQLKPSVTKRQVTTEENGESKRIKWKEWKIDQ